MRDIEKERFLLNTPISEREREYCICRKRFNKDDPSLPMVACNICDEWYHVECIRFSYPFVRAVPFFVCPNCVDTTFSGFLSYIRHRAWEVINYQIKDITFICKEYFKVERFNPKSYSFSQASIPMERNVKSIHCTFIRYFNSSRNNKSTL